MAVIKVEASNPASQGPFVEIEAEDFNAEIHKLYAEAEIVVKKVKAKVAEVVTEVVAEVKEVVAEVAADAPGWGDNEVA
jgi:tryptophanyl-tRNA synthetase